MNDTLISVIVPVYKVEKYLDRCVSSVVNQTYKDLEIILVDDGSPDTCPAMCDEWAKRDDRIKVIHKENGGLSDARNAGLAVAMGAYVSFVDSDDWLDLNFLQILYDLSVQTDADIAECSFVKTSGETISFEDSGDITVCTTEEALKRHMNIEMFKQVVWNKLYRKKVLNVLFEKGKVHEDEFWTYQIIANCERLAHIEKRLYFYYQRSDSIMGEGYSVKRLDALEAKFARNAFIKSHYPQLSYLSETDLCFTCMYHGQLMLKYLDNKQKKQAIARIKELYPKKVTMDKKSMKLSHLCWLKLAKINFELCCRIRSILGIGL